MISPGSKLEVVNGQLYVNDKLFEVTTTDEPIVGIEDGRLVTLFRGHLYNYWPMEDIDGSFRL